GGGVPPTYSIQVLGYEHEQVREIAEELGRRLQAFSRIQEVDVNASDRYERDRATELVLELDRPRLAMHGVSAREVVGRIGAAVAGTEGLGDVVRVGEEELRYAVKLAGHRQLDVLALQELAIPTS